MAAELEERDRELIRGKNFAHIATINGDGKPHIAIAWVDVDGDEILLNSAAGRLWPRNLDRNPQVALTVTNQADPYQYLEVRGQLASTATEGALEHIDSMAQKYWGQDQFPRHPGEQRVIFRIRPQRVRRRGY
jgi:PPOX class probable F420-dependent enzyme